MTHYDPWVPIHFPNLIYKIPCDPLGSPYTFQTSCHEQTRAKRGFLRVQIINEMLKNDYFSVEGKGTLQTLHTYLHFLQIFFKGVKLCVRETGKTLLCSMYPSKKGLFFLMPLAQRMPIFNKKNPMGNVSNFQALLRV